MADNQNTPIDLKAEQEMGMRYHSKECGCFGCLVIRSRNPVRITENPLPTPESIHSQLRDGTWLKEEEELLTALQALRGNWNNPRYNIRRDCLAMADIAISNANKRRALYREAVK